MFGNASGEKTIAFPFVGNPTDLGAFGSLIAFGVLLLTPNVIKKAKDAIGAPAGEVFSGVMGGVGAGAGAAKVVGLKPAGKFFANGKPGNTWLRQKSPFGKWHIGAGPIARNLSRFRINPANRGEGYFGKAVPKNPDGTGGKEKAGFNIGGSIVGGVFPPKKSEGGH